MKSPNVSVILPTYNRADSIMRAVASVLAQDYEDWELIVVDDGSTDGTADVLRGVDSRIRVLTQDNSGVYVARNLGLSESLGQYITFLDSDDEWLPHFLQLTTTFLKRFPEDHFVTTEFIERRDDSQEVLHNARDVSEILPRVAASLGSKMLKLPEGESDDYLRVYSSKERIGEWAGPILRRLGRDTAYLYRGNIFECMRFGYLNWLPITMLTRTALREVGLFDATRKSAADYRFLAMLSRRFRANMIAIPSAIKHDKLQGSRDLAEAHLATGPREYAFALNKMAFFEELYGGRDGKDQTEISVLRSFHELYAGRTALKCGHRAVALEHLRKAARPRRVLWKAYPLSALVFVLPGRVASRVYRRLLRAQDVARRLASGKLTVLGAGKKVMQRLRGKDGVAEGT